MTRLITIVALLVISIAPGSDAQVTITGSVIDAITSDGVDRASIRLSNSSSTYYTSADGDFTITISSDSDAIVTVDRVGYEQKSMPIYDLMKNKISEGLYNAVIAILPTLITPGTIEVNEGRIETELKYATIPIALITEDDIKGLPYIAIPNVIEMKTGLNILRDGIWANDISIRGLSRDNVIMLINGNRIETANNHSGRLALIDLNTIDRVEFIKGGTSSVYGSGAMGGIVNIITRPGVFGNATYLSGSVTGSYSSVNELSTGNLSLQLSGKNYYSNVFLTTRNATDVSTPDGIISNSSFRDEGLHVDGGINLNGKSMLKSTIEYYHSPYAGIPGGKTVFPDNSVTSYINAERIMADLTYEIADISSSMPKFFARAFYQDINRDVEVFPNSTVKMPVTGSSPAKRIINVSIYPSGSHELAGIQLQNDFLLSGKNRLVTGIDVWQRKLETRRQRTQIIQTLDSAENIISVSEVITGDVPVPDSKFTSAGIFLQNQTSFMNEDLFLDFSARLDGIFISNEETYSPTYTITNGVRNESPPSRRLLWPASDNEDFSWSLGAGLNYRLGNNWNANANFSASYRSPGLEERFQYIDLGSTVRLGNPDLKSERGYFSSGGIKFWGEKLNIKAEIFYNALNDLVVEVPGVYEGRQALIKENIGSATIYGAEAEIELSPLKDFGFIGGFSYTFGNDDETDDPLAQIAPMNFRLGAEYASGFGLRANLNSIIYTEQDRVADGELKTPGYAVLNLNASYLLRLSRAYSITITGGIENLLDKDYRIHLSTSRGPVVSEPGRNLFLNLILNFK